VNSLEDEAMTGGGSTLGTPGLHAQRVIKFVELVSAATENVDRGFTANSRDELFGLVAADTFVAVGRSKQVMDWADFFEQMDRCAGQAEFRCEVKHIDEVENLVFLELEERNSSGHDGTVLKTMTVFEFDSGGKLQRLDLFR
jgi:hypothetical protein